MISFKAASTLWATATFNLVPVAIAASALTVGSVMYAPAANAASFTGSLSEFTGDDAAGEFTFSDIGNNTGTVQLLAKIKSPTVGGDIRGIFFDVLGGTSGLTVTPVPGQGAGITISNLNFNTCAAGQGNNLTGGGAANPCNFDVGFAVGRPGAAGGTITSALFTITRSGLTASSFAGQTIGVRYQATGGSAGSSKLSGTTSATAVPTPALLPGLIGMGVAAMRKRKGEAEESAEA